MIQATKLGRRFGERDVLRGLDLDIPSGSFLLVTGGNGSGKSTLLSLLAGLLAPTAGDSGNYSIHGLTIFDAQLVPNQRTVHLSTSGISPGSRDLE